MIYVMYQFVAGIVSGKQVTWDLGGGIRFQLIVNQGSVMFINY